MKKLAIIVIALTILVGFALADPGIPPVPESQGIVTSTSIDGVGNLASATEIQWRISYPVTGLPDIPPLTAPNRIYESTYTEATQSHGVGLVFYDKELDVETSGQISGQWNIEATKQLAFVGVDGAHVVSSDNIMVDGAGQIGLPTTTAYICPFVEDVASLLTPFCNRAEAGSTIDMTVANVRTTTTDRFVMPSSDHPVELNHDIRVTELVADVPSMGMASAYMDVLIQESRSPPALVDPTTLQERIEFTEETSFDGAITVFDKLMHYESGMVR